MAAARDQAQVGRLDRLVAQGARHDVPVEMVHRHERQAAGRRERLRGGHPHEQGADQPRAAGHGDRVDVVEPHARPLQRVRGDRVDQLQVVA